ncbi:mechanosensitive ion channel family protein [Pandoraea sp. PE-S2R-1]|uniref:mechanosensitive ion channel family protein n=1 Tax=Pandoraea sp. PE-S2R-1 TaxID=1986994 RepID=UPI000B3F7FB7|nr:mechanosensitive ion channel domain-containing protein [Pandoraea sp. PE-S2R-1]
MMTCTVAPATLPGISRDKTIRSSCRKLVSRSTFFLMSLAICLAMALASPVVHAQASRPAAASDASAADLRYMDRPIATFRASLSGATPQQRADRSYAVLDGLPESVLSLPTQAVQASMGQNHGVVFRRGDRILFALLAGDVDEADDRPFEVIAQETQVRLDTALAARQAQLHWPNIIRGILFSLLATVVLGVVVWIAGRLQTRLQTRIQYAVEAHLLRRTSQTFDWTGSAFQLARQIVQLLFLFFVAALIYVYLIYVLERFPVSEPMGERLSSFLWDLLNTFALGIVNAIPGLIAIAVIFLLTRALHNLINNVFSAIQQRHLNIPGLHPDTAGASRRIVAIVVWALALTFAYPYFPGAQSDVFKGLSVLLGLMISLGSAGIVNQLMSGIVVTYSRAFQAGDMVQIGDTAGVVVSVDTLSVKLTNVRREEVTIPNAVVVGAIVHNFSSRDGKAPALVVTSVTIGYDTPWRQVQAMLSLAAARTKSVAQSPAPFVLQRSLSDFYIEYDLHVAPVNPAQRLVMLSELHSQIVDVFNEYGVQIMSPHFEEQPEMPVVIAREGWAPSPAQESAGPHGANET